MFQGMVEELLMKNLIQESLNPCIVLAFLILKKDKAWRICVDNKVVNKITIKYHFLFPILKYMLDKIKVSKALSRMKVLGTNRIANNTT